MQKSKISKIQNETKKLLIYLNKEYLRLHAAYENYFWISYMGDHSIDKKKDTALKELDTFKSNHKLFDQVKILIENNKLTKEDKEKLNAWTKFFNCYQTPKHLNILKDKISKLETKMGKVATTRKEGYIDPHSNKFVEASSHKMRGMLRTEKDENLRKAFFLGGEKLAYSNIKNYVKYVGLLNQYAIGLGFADFYEYKIFTEEGMTKNELFKIFDHLYKKTKFAFTSIRKLEKKIPGLRKPWNFSYMMAVDFTMEEDQYFPFEEALIRWGKSFAALGIDFRGSSINLDLLDRKGKYSNGFCHWPVPIHYKDGKRITGLSNFTCNVVYGQVGSAVPGYNTLFHEGGHAAHLLNSEQTEVCLNHEYPPMSTAWAETHSMFLDTLYSSYEWRSRYAKNQKGEIYPFELFKRKIERLSILRPLGLNSIMAICNFEKIVYEEKKLTTDKVIKAAKKIWKKYQDYSEDSLRILTVPHIYSWSSTCSYHGYGLAELALTQWREYFYDKYGYIVDNPKVGEEMARVWKLGASKNFKDFVKIMTGKKLSANAWLKNTTKSLPQILKLAKDRALRLKKVPQLNGPIKLNAKIRMLSGKKNITDNSKSFEDMASKYAVWLKTKRIK